MSAYPTPWQKRTMWAALTAFFVVLLTVIAAAVVYVGANLISFLQPILIPVAIAIILAYLLDPLVTLICHRGMGRIWAILVIFLSALVALAGLFWWVVPTISDQSASFAKELPSYTQTARDRIVDLVVRYNRTFEGPNGARGKSATSGLVNLLLGTPPPRSNASPSATPSPTPSPESAVESIAPAPPKLSSAERQKIEADVEKMIAYIQHQLPAWSDKVWNITQKSIGGFLGVAGFLLSLVMVPIYLFFLLKERPRIERRWKDYLPLRASPLKDEIAEALLEINNYVIAYFRGQLLVCLVDGMLIGAMLTLLGLNFAPLIGLLVIILTMIPYIGIIICWVPAVLIAAFQWGDWMHPVIVTAIFILIQNLEGMFYAPRIVGKSVGLHPMTVIVSIFVWGLLIGGLLGPILAVPLTATIKVLLTRYVWGPRMRDRIRAQVTDVPVVSEAHGKA
ncbi:MAG TPA: AI-2E family transporter [Chthoniobacterales bacterium]|nr:AI-2E family transporter [Chthoniobacterales bacterium]